MEGAGSARSARVLEDALEESYVPWPLNLLVRDGHAVGGQAIEE